MTKDIVIRTAVETDNLMEMVRASAARAQQTDGVAIGDPLDLLRRMKFDPPGFHPLEDRPLNLDRATNQTWTFAVAIAAARQLLNLHPRRERVSARPRRARIA